MVAHLGQTIIPLNGQLACTIQVGDTLNVEVTVRNTYPASKVLKSYCVMTVDRINELVACRLLSEKEV